MAVSFLHTTVSTADTNAYTFSAEDLGAAASDRNIIVTIMSRSTTGGITISSVTIGGVSATITGQTNAGAGPSNVGGIVIAEVPTGTSGDIVVTFSASMLRCGIGVYRATGLTSINASDSDSTNALAAPSVSLDVPANGFVIGGAATATSTTTTWTELTETFDGVIESALTHTGALKEYASAQTGLTMTATFGSNSSSIGVFASWEQEITANSSLPLLGVG